jgi:uncharacterized protein
VIAIDTQLLVYAHRAECASHGVVLARLLELAQSGRQWAIPWPCVHEFLNSVTRARLFSPPSTMEQALAAIHAWQASPDLHFLGEGPNHLARLGRLLLGGKVTGPAVHDARIAAICLSHGVEVLWTADRDFSRFPELRTINPLVQ